MPKEDEEEDSPKAEGWHKKQSGQRPRGDVFVGAALAAGERRTNAAAREARARRR